MTTRIQVTIDCADPDRLARFWAEALDYRSIVDPEGVGPRIWFQPVPEGKVVKNRLHLDLGGERRPPGSPGDPPAGPVPGGARPLRERVLPPLTPSVQEPP